MKTATLATAAAALLLSTAAFAQTRYGPIDPPSQANTRGARGNLGDRDPWGNPAPSGCTWSRIQVPTARGLQWQAIEDCNPDMWR